MALLRSYAIPEVYGRSRTHSGGTYRIWRQVELTCIQGRNIGVPRSLDPSSNAGTTNDQEVRSDVEAVDLDLFCEVYLNSVLSGRTVVKKSTGSPDWHENFLFTDLPPFEKLAVVVWREKKLQKPFVIGTVYITLTNFRRGEQVEGWFPVLFGGATTASTQVGQLRLKIRLDESVVSLISCEDSPRETMIQGNRVTFFQIFKSDGCTYSMRLRVPGN
jgi:C2 domain-containing protein